VLVIVNFDGIDFVGLILVKRFNVKFIMFK